MELIRSFNPVDEYLNNRQKEILLKLLVNPADTGNAYASSLQELVRSYPQSGLLRALYGRAMNEASPLSAGAYFEGRALYKLINHHDSLLPVDKAQVILQAGHKPLNGQSTAKSEPVDAPQTQEVNSYQPVADKNDNNIFSDKPLAFPDVLNVEWPGNIGEQGTQETTTSLNEEHVSPQDNIDTNLAHEPWQPVADKQADSTDEPLGRAPWEDDEEEESPVPVADTPASTPWELDEEGDEPGPYAETPPESAPWVHEEQEQPVPVAEIPTEPAPWEEIGNAYDAPGTEIPVEEPHDSPEQVYADEANPIDEEVYDEITGIDDIELVQHPADISGGPVAADEALTDYEQQSFVPVSHAYEEELMAHAYADPHTYEEPVPVYEELAAPAYQEPVADAGEAQPAAQDEADKLIMGNIAATDYFTFDRAFGDNKKTEEEPDQQSTYRPARQESLQHNQPSPAAENATQHDVSKYHDEKMPYTFMWWLDKTRKEHGFLYQPYAKAPANKPEKSTEAKPQADELQQQYFENIFHLSTVEELTPDEAAQTIEFDMQSKGDRIIQRFITEDPQIHPPVGEKLDTENKAKKSSEDHNDLVTETLARIYADQMLFPKAIATYKKLMLKFPEKSRYFASRIENLEKKTN